MPAPRSALETLRERLADRELDASDFFPVAIEGWILLDEGRAAEAVPMFERARALGAPPFITAYLGLAYGPSGEREKALAQVQELERISVDGTPAAFSLGLIQLGLGERARAIEYFERAVAEESQQLPWLGLDAIFDPLREDPRFKSLLKRVDF